MVTEHLKTHSWSTGPKLQLIIMMIIKRYKCEKSITLIYEAYVFLTWEAWTWTSSQSKIKPCFTNDKCEPGFTQTPVYLNVSTTAEPQNVLIVLQTQLGALGTVLLTH